MIQTRSYHGAIIDECVAEGSNKIAYLILPERLDADGLRWIERTSASYNISIAIISGIDWNNDLTPWVADSLGKKDMPFRGHASFFLGTFIKDYLTNIEDRLNITKASRTLVGVSLSGLFALWTAHNCDSFDNIVSISGSFWYDHFAEWVQGHDIFKPLDRAYIAIGDKEKKNKDPRFNNLLPCTETIVEDMRKKASRLKFEIEPGTSHFSSIIPRLEKAFDYIYSSKTEGDGDDD